MAFEPSVGSLISFSWNKTKEILLPFEFKRWLRILLIVWLSGHAAGWGGGGGQGARRSSKPAQERVQQEEAAPKVQAAEPSQDQTTQPPIEPREKLDDTAGIPRGTSPGPSGPPKGDRGGIPPRLIPVIIIAIPVVIALALFFSWLGARFNFIFLDLMVHRDVRIRESFRTHKLVGNSYFLWSLGFGLVCLGIFVALAFLIAIVATTAKVLLWLVIPAFLAFLIAFIAIAFLTSDFIPPIMYQDGIKTMDAVKKFISFRPKVGQVALYLLLMIGFGIVIGLAVLLLSLVVALVLLIAAVVVVFLGAGLASVLPFLKPLLVACGIVGLIAGILALMVILGLMTLPVPIFFRAFALSYLTRLIPDYNLLGLPPSDSFLSGDSL